MNTKINILKAHIRLLHMATFAEKMIRMMSYGLLKASQNDKFFEETVQYFAPHLDEQGLEEVTQLIKEQDIDSALKGAKGAALIFIHTGLEGCLDELVELDARSNPNDWMNLFPDKQISIKDAIQEASDKLVAILVEDYIKRYKRYSLLKKLHALLSVLKPKHSEMKQYRYDKERIQRIDHAENFERYDWQGALWYWRF